jgi:hypothetical protein
VFAGLGALILAALAAPADAQLQWVPSRGQYCADICEGAGMAPVASGRYTNGQPFFICAGNINGEGPRGGYNVLPNNANACWVGWGGRETPAPSFTCLCTRDGGGRF